MKQELPLRDIHLPDAVSWWPPAIGWWLILAIIIIGSALLIWRLRSPKPAPKPAIHWRPLLQDEFNTLQQAYAEHNQQQRLAQELSVLLRKAVLKENPTLAQTAAGQTGVAWLNTLDQHFGLQAEFSQHGMAIIQAPYNPNISFDADRLLELVSRALSASHTQEDRHA